ncbi:hypothetical protein QQ045_022848 [Rhodiola kirilowii]
MMLSGTQFFHRSTCLLQNSSSSELKLEVLLVVVKKCLAVVETVAADPLASAVMAAAVILMMVRERWVRTEAASADPAAPATRAPANEAGIDLCQLPVHVK